MLEKDIAPYFRPEEASSVFSLFDRDGNGDASREEVELACLWVLSVVNFTLLSNLYAFSREFHREQLSIENSMQDLDSAVGRLDNILMSVYVVVAVLIIAVALVRAKSADV
jgi:hypothetical protein